MAANFKGGRCCLFAHFGLYTAFCSLQRGLSYRFCFYFICDTGMANFLAHCIFQGICICNQPVHQLPGGRLFCAQQAPGKHHIKRGFHTDTAQGTSGSPIAGQNTKIYFRKAQFCTRLINRHNPVTWQGNFQPAANRHPVNTANGGNSQIFHCR